MQGKPVECRHCAATVVAFGPESDASLSQDSKAFERKERWPVDEFPVLPGDNHVIAVITTADTEILTLSHVVKTLPVGLPAVRAVNPGSIASIERFMDETIEQCHTAVVVRLLGGKRSFDAGLDRIRESCLRRGVPFIACAGDSAPDLELTALSTVPPETVQQVFTYFVHGGPDNLRNLLLTLSGLPAQPAQPLPWFGLYHPDGEVPPRDPAKPTVALLFYRAHWMSRNLDFVDALVRQLEVLECNALPVFVYSLKAENFGQIEALLQEAGIDVIINTLSFAMGAESVEFLRRFDVPVLQAIVSTSSREQWLRNPAGLTPIDTAMNVALPEFDGTIITVPVSFKEQADHDEALGTTVSRYVADPERVNYVARLARNWGRLRRIPNKQKKIAFVLSNYPTKNARIGNAVGLDTPASVVGVLKAMAAAGYDVQNMPASGDELIVEIIDRCSNDRDFLTEDQLANAVGHVTSGEYRRWFEGFPADVRHQLTETWGEPPGEVFRYGDDAGHSGHYARQRLRRRSTPSRFWGASHRHLPLAGNAADPSLPRFLPLDTGRLRS